MDFNAEDLLTHLELYFLNIDLTTVGPVSRAAFIGDKDGLEVLIKNNDSSEKDNYGQTPLHYAAFRGNIDCVLLLLETGHSEIDTQCISGRTALDLVCASVTLLKDTQYEVIETLFKCGATTDNERRLEHCDLNSLILNENLPAVKLLVSNGADTSISDRSRGTPLEVAVNMGKIEILRYLIDLGIRNSPSSSAFGGHVLQTAIYFATNSTVSDVVCEVLTHDICRKNINEVCHSGDSTVVYVACEKGHHETVHLLLDNGADVNIGSHCSPLEALLDSLDRENPDTEFWNCMKRVFHLTSDEVLIRRSAMLFMHSIWLKCGFLFKKLLSIGASPNKHIEKENWLLGEDELYTQLINTWALIPGEYANVSPLGLALFYCRNENDTVPEVIKLLLDAGCSMTTLKDEDGINIIPPFVIFMMNCERRLNFRPVCAYNVLEEILKVNPDLEWNCTPDVPIPVIYFAPLFNNNFETFSILLQWGVPADVMFTKEKCAQMVPFVKNYYTSEMAYPGWYVKILNLFIPNLPTDIIDIYEHLTGFSDIKSELVKLTATPKSLQHLSALAIRKQLYKANKTPLKISIDTLCQGRPCIIRRKLLLRDVIAKFCLENSQEPGFWLTKSVTSFESFMHSSRNRCLD